MSKNTYVTKYPTKFLPIRDGRALRGGFIPVPIGTELTLLQKVKTESGRALFSAAVNGQTLYGYQDIEFLSVLKNDDSAAIIEQIIAAARSSSPRYTIVERFEIKGTDGKWYSLGMPWGVKSTGERSAPYYVRMTRDGTTIGKRFESREELQADMDKCQAGRDNEFRTALLAMNKTQLAAQVAYWLPENKLAA